MAPHLLKHLTASLFRQVTQMSRLNPATVSSTSCVSRCLGTFTAVPRLLLSSTARICSIPLPSSGLLAQRVPSLGGQCQPLPSIQPSAGMKTKSALKRRCKDCFFVRRRGHLFVFCKTNPKHKQRQG